MLKPCCSPISYGIKPRCAGTRPMPAAIWFPRWPIRQQTLNSHPVCPHRPGDIPGRPFFIRSSCFSHQPMIILTSAITGWPSFLFHILWSLYYCALSLTVEILSHKLSSPTTTENCYAERRPLAMIYVVCLKRSVNGTTKQTKQKIQTN
jgi:hypothetical protein